MVSRYPHCLKDLQHENCFDVKYVSAKDDSSVVQIVNTVLMDFRAQNYASVKQESSKAMNGHT